MARFLNIGVAAALVLAIAAPAAPAQSLMRRPHHRPVHHTVDVVRPGDIVVHARSYLDPGQPGWNEVGTGARYATDTTPASMVGLGSSFSDRGFDTLPTRFNPPGRPQPLFEFSEP